MTNKDSSPVSELVEALRECAVMVREGKCEMLSEFWHDEAAKLTAEACAEAADRLTALEEENAQLREALKRAKETIRAWHGENAWDIYDRASPEMQVINAALSTAPQGGDHGE